MRYKGYNIGKLSRYIYEGGRDGYYWNVNKDGRNVCFNTLREAKEWINKQVNEHGNTTESIQRGHRGCPCCSSE